MMTHATWEAEAGLCEVKSTGLHDEFCASWGFVVDPDSNE